MPGSEFSTTVSARGSDAVIELRGDVNRAAQAGLDAAYVGLPQSTERVLLDFRDVDYINSTGIALIVTLLARARADGRLVGAFGLTPHYTELFSITRLSDFMTIYADETAAAAGT
jgi:anti-anti-sigma factor